MRDFGHPICRTFVHLLEQVQNASQFHPYVQFCNECAYHAVKTPNRSLCRGLHHDVAEHTTLSQSIHLEQLENSPICTVQYVLGNFVYLRYSSCSSCGQIRFCIFCLIFAHTTVSHGNTFPWFHFFVFICVRHRNGQSLVCQKYKSQSKRLMENRGVFKLL